MTDKHDESVLQSMSAMMDDEHNELDLRRVLKAADENEAVLPQWSRLQLVRHVLQKEQGPVCDLDFAAKVRGALDDEPSYSQSTVSYLLYKAKRASGQLGVAACVSFAVLVGAHQWGMQQAEQEALVAANATAKSQQESLAVVPEGFELPPITARTVSSLPQMNASPRASSVQRVSAAPRAEVLPSLEMRQQLARLMYKHADSASANGGLGVLPLMRVAALKNESNE